MAKKKAKKTKSKLFGIRSGSKELAFVAAAGGSKLPALKGLLAEGVDINARPDGRTALHEACRRGRLKAVEFLIKAGAKVNLPDKDDTTPLMTACLNGKVMGSQIAIALLRAGAHASVARSDGMTPLKFAVDRCTPQVLQALIDAGAMVDGPRGTEQTALMLAARANNVESLQVLLKNGADPTLPCKLPWAEGRNAEGLAELERQRKALAYLRKARGA